MAFFQDPPRLTNTFDDDALLREYLARRISPTTVAAVEPELRHLGDLAAGKLLEMQAADRLAEPRHVPFDAWGRRVDRIELTPLWREAAALAARHGLVATAPARPRQRVDEWPVDDRAHRRLGRGSRRDGGAAGRGRLAAVRHEVVQL